MAQKLPEFFFYASFALTGFTFLLLMMLSRRSGVNFWFAGVIVPAILGVVYTAIMLMFWFQEPPTPAPQPRDFFSLEGLGRLFESRGLRAAAFIDILLLSVMVAAWMARRAAQARVPTIYLILCLLITLALPGTGVVLFLIIVGIGGRLKKVAEFEGVPSSDSKEVEART